MEISVDPQPNASIATPNKEYRYPIGKSHAYLYIRNYPYIIIAPKGLLFIVGIIFITLIISSLSMIVFTWSWIGWTLLAVETAMHLITSLINPGSPQIAQSTKYCKMCGLPNDKAVHCFKCGLCFESKDVSRVRPPLLSNW